MAEVVLNLIDDPYITVFAVQNWPGSRREKAGEVNKSAYETYGL